MTAKHFPLPNENTATTPHFNPFRLQRILLVACDLKVIELNAEMLREAGYHVCKAANGLVAWDAIQVSNFDLLITDQFLPGITGIDLVQKIYAAHLDLPVIMAKGFLPAYETVLHPCLNSITMLQTPYTAVQLLKLVDAALDQTSVKQVKLVQPSFNLTAQSQVSTIPISLSP